jgi:carbon-monoxide dehydrogenase medium subunit
MYPRSFRYYAPSTLAKATEFLAEHPEDAKLLAGGQSLIPMMKLRLSSPAYIVDINRLPGLSYIKVDGGMLRIGALTRHSEIEHSPIVKEKLPILSEVASQIADQQVRNLGTVAGSICHADPAADWPAATLALDSVFELTGASTRTVIAPDFFKGPFETALEAGEVMTEIRVPIPSAKRVGQAYVKFERKAGDFATVGVASIVELDDGWSVSRARIALTAVAPKQYRATKAEEHLRGKVPNEEEVEKAARLAAEQSDPAADLRGSVEYKREMVRVFTRRSLKLALQRAGLNL